MWTSRPGYFRSRRNRVNASPEIGAGAAPAGGGGARAVPGSEAAGAPSIYNLTARAGPTRPNLSRRGLRGRAIREVRRRNILTDVALVHLVTSIAAAAAGALFAHVGRLSLSLFSAGCSCRPPRARPVFSLSADEVCLVNATASRPPPFSSFSRRRFRVTRRRCEDGRFEVRKWGYRVLPFG